MSVFLASLPQHLADFVIDVLDENSAKKALAALRLVSKSCKAVVAGYRGSFKKEIVRDSRVLLNLRKSLPSLASLCISSPGPDLVGSEQLLHFSDLHHIQLWNSGHQYGEIFVALADLPSSLQKLELRKICFYTSGLWDLKCIGVTYLSIEWDHDYNEMKDVCQLVLHLPALKVPRPLRFLSSQQST